MEQRNSSQHFHASIIPAIVVFFLLMIDLLTACNQAAPNLQATLAKDPSTPTDLAVVARTPVLSVTPTNSYTSTPTATPGIFNQVPVLPNSGSFIVTTPDAKLLWDVVRMAGNVNQRDGDDENLKIISDTERIAIYRLIEHDLLTYYPQGIPDTMDLIENTDFTALGYEPFLSDLISENLVTKFNQENLKLTTGKGMTVVDFDLTPYLLELDGDSNNEWLIKVKNDRLSFNNWIYVDELENSTFRLLPSDSLTMPFGEQIIQVTYDHDLTGDGLNEVIFSAFDYAWGSNFGFVQVFTWDGTRVSRILALEKYIRSTDFGTLDGLTIDFSIGDVNGDGREEIQVRLPRSDNFGCKWDEVGNYRWDGVEPKFKLNGVTPPETPICWVAQGLSSTNDLTIEQKVKLLEKALNNLSPASASPDLLALLRVHLGVGYTILGKDVQAKQTLAGIERLSSNNSLVKVIQDEYQAANGSVLVMCDGLFRSAQAGELPYENETIQYLSYSASLGAYGFNSSPYPPMLCPLPVLANFQLETANLPASSSPIELLEMMGFRVETSAGLQLDEDEPKEIVAVVELGEPQIIVLDLNQDVWKVSRAARLSAPVDDVQFLAYDIYQDNKIELLVSALLKEPVPESAFSSCWGPDAGNTTQYIVINKEGTHYGALWADELCGEKQDLEEFVENNRFEFALLQGGILSSDQNLAEIFRRKYAFSLQELSQIEDRDLWHGMDQLLDEILTGQATISSDKKTKAIINWISPAAPGGDRITQRALYFTGIYFELNGQLESAGKVYKQLILKWPDSIWSWLAWARINVSAAAG